MFLTKVLSLEIETITLSYLRSLQLEISVAVTCLARSRMSAFQTVNNPVFQSFLDLASKTASRFALAISRQPVELASGSEKSQSGVKKQEGKERRLCFSWRQQFFKH